MKTNLKTKTYILFFIVSLLFSPYSYSEDKAKATGYDVSNSNTENLTDQERFVVDNYVHEGKVQQEYLEACGEKQDDGTYKLNDDACLGNKATAFSEDADTIIEAAAKAYSMILPMTGMVSMMGGGTSSAAKDLAKATGKGKDAKEPSKDYCQFIPMASETIATVTQQANQQSIAASSKTESNKVKQKELLYQASRSHDARATNSTIQTAGWGSSAGCYAAKLAYDSITLKGAIGDHRKNIAMTALKMGASAFLAGFYGKQMTEHRKYRDKVKEIADELPGKGDCNPITDRECYCSQESTKYDPKYCMTGINKLNIAKGAVRTSCIDSNAKSDPTCQCATNNTCVDQAYMTTLNGMNLDPNLAKQATNAMKSLTNGQLSAGLVSQAATAGQGAANLKAMLTKSNSKVSAPSSLNASQEKQANALQKLGVPVNLSRSIAALPLSPRAKKQVAALKQGKSSYKYRYRPRSRRNSSEVLTFSGSGNGLLKKKSKKKSTDRMAFLKKFRQKKLGGKKSSEVLMFAEKAANNAQITNNKDVSIFKIISRRYQVTGKKRLTE